MVCNRWGGSSQKTNSQLWEWEPLKGGFLFFKQRGVEVKNDFYIMQNVFVELLPWAWCWEIEVESKPWSLPRGSHRMTGEKGLCHTKPQWLWEDLCTQLPRCRSMWPVYGCRQLFPRSNSDSLSRKISVPILMWSSKFTCQYKERRKKSI